MVHIVSHILDSIGWNESDESFQRKNILELTEETWRKMIWHANETTISNVYIVMRSVSGIFETFLQLHSYARMWVFASMALISPAIYSWLLRRIDKSYRAKKRQHGKVDPIRIVLFLCELSMWQQWRILLFIEHLHR